MKSNSAEIFQFLISLVFQTKEKDRRDIQSVRGHLPHKNEGRIPTRLRLQDATAQVMMMPEENQGEKKMHQKRDANINLKANRQTIKSTGRDTQKTAMTSTTIENVESVTTAIRNSNFHSCNLL